MDRYLSCVESQEYTKLISCDEWILDTVKCVEKKLSKVPTSKKILWDVSGIKSFDTAGMILFVKYLDKFSKVTEVNVTGYSRKQLRMYRLLKDTDSLPVIAKKDDTISRLGKSTIDTMMDIRDFSAFLGHLISAMVYTLFHPKVMRFKEMAYHIYHSGFNAIVIVGMTAFLVGMVIAYQGSVVLAKFGADLFIVDTVGISIVRELGPMITAIVIAGRSGSAYTAEIGVMKVTEEISAMETMGFDPYYFLVIPRVFALMISLPLLIFFADIVGIFGGMVASTTQLNISTTQFLDRLHEVVNVRHYILGMIKGPLFAFLIVTIGCFRGFQVSDNTESIGLQTTASVVNSIFLVIAFDALFSVIYTSFGL